MKTLYRYLFSLVLSLAFTGSIFSQECGSISPEEAIRANANLTEQEKETRINALEEKFQQDFKKWKENKVDNQKAEVYIIPTVVHIFHDFGPENLSEEQVRDMIRVLNEDFNAENQALDNLVPEFKPIIGDTEVEFRLATFGPLNGTGNPYECTNGIIRYHDPNTYYSNRQPIQDLKVQHGWPSNEYLNVYVVGSIEAGAGGGVIAGYAQFPGFGSPQTDGIVVAHNYVGSIGTSTPSRAATTTHEVGHWFSLFHTWGNCAAAGTAAACGCDDGVDDTPLTQGHPSTCPLGAETCGNLNNVQNFMDYSFCYANFTIGQADRMRFSLESNASRSNLYRQENLELTGADYALNDPPTTLCNAEMEFNDNIVYCVGQSIDFLDRSFHNVTSRTWTFEDGSPANSSDINPSVAFNTPGLKTITLEVSNGVNTLTETREVLIRDVNERGAYPLVDDIENIDLSVEDDYSVTNNGGPAWVVNQNVSNGSGTKSLYINNRVQTASSGEDVIVSNTIDLSNYSGEAGLEIAFDYAFAQRTNADNSDVLRLTVSNDCGETWRSVNLGTLTRFSLRTKTEQESGNFVPAGPEEWKSRACPIPEDLLTSNFQFRFVWVPGEGNNLYLDNIRIQEQGTSSVLTNDVLAKSFEVYPNPVKNRINVSLDLPAVDKMDISLYNVLGAKQGDLFSGDLPAGANELGFDLDVKPGVYFVRIEADGIQSSKRIVVQ